MTYDNSHDTDVLARTLYGEAESNNTEDAKAIANVILNRQTFSNWPDTISEVCQQPFQFSCWNTSDPNRQRILAAKGAWFEICKSLAVEAIDGGLHDTTNSSTHYYATYVKSPRWAKGKRPVYTVAHKNGHAHIFFNNIDTKPPETARQALDQTRPLAKTRTMKGSAVVAATGASAIAAGVAEQVSSIAPAMPVVSTVAETAHNHPTGLLILFGAIVILFGIYIAWARLDDRKRGLR